ncbi:hypothetical protein KSS87_009730, partial [Heliosperma pusillum]
IHNFSYLDTLVYLNRTRSVKILQLY